MVKRHIRAILKRPELPLVAFIAIEFEVGRRKSPNRRRAAMVFAFPGKPSFSFVVSEVPLRESRSLITSAYR